LGNFGTIVCPSTTLEDQDDPGIDIIWSYQKRKRGRFVSASMPLRIGSGIGGIVRKTIGNCYGIMHLRNIYPEISPNLGKIKR
jgi:hypothetical protein